MMAETELTLEEVSDSLTGFDEIAITQQFGRTVTDLAQHDPSMFGRAMVFVVKRRDGATDDDARNAAMAMTMKDYAVFFSDASEDESGKGVPSEEQPASSLSSVS